MATLYTGFFFFKSIFKSHSLKDGNEWKPLEFRLVFTDGLSGFVVVVEVVDVFDVGAVVVVVFRTIRRVIDA